MNISKDNMNLGKMLISFILVCIAIQGVLSFAIPQTPAVLPTPVSNTETGIGNVGELCVIVKFIGK